MAAGRRRRRSRRHGRTRAPPAGGEQGTDRPDHHGQLAPGRGDLGVRAARPPLSALRHARPLRGTAGPSYLLVPVLPAWYRTGGSGARSARPRLTLYPAIHVAATTAIPASTPSAPA